MYPLKLNPVFKEMLWGGSRLNSIYDMNIPSEITGESWNISCRKDEMCIVGNGRFKGETFESVLNLDRQAYLGDNLYLQKDFPLLIKIIDAQDNLSVQVHPNDELANSLENYVYGKTEMWYILEAPIDAYLIIGLKPETTRESFKQSLVDGDVENLLGKLYIKTGDVINIPSGLIHAITAGVLLAEIQQNSDITYRVYDYNRKNADGLTRELHVEKAMQVIDFDGKIKTDKVQGLSIKIDDNEIIYYIANKYFAIEKYCVSKSIECMTDGLKFVTYTCVSGCCEIYTNARITRLNLGESIFIPAKLWDYKIVGCCELLKGYVPDIEEDFIKPLTENGYTLEEIKSKTSIER